MSKKKTLADLMDNDFFIDFDNTEEKAKRKQLAESLKRKPTLTESVEKAVEKSLTEDTDVVRMAAWCARNCQDFYKAIITNSSYKKLGRAAYKALKERYGIDGEEAEDVMCKGYVIWKQRHWDGTNESLKENTEEPDNAVVDCKVNKVIAHCEDEKPVDCLGKKKPLEKPLTEEKPLNSLVKDLEYTTTPTELEKAEAEIKKLYGAEVLKDDESLPQIFTLYKELTGMNAAEVEQRRDRAVKQNKCRVCGGDLANLVCTHCGTKHQADGSDRDVGSAHANVFPNSYRSGFTTIGQSMNSADDFLNFYAVVHKLRQERQLDTDNWTKNDPQAKRANAVIKFASEESKNRLKAEIEKQQAEIKKAQITANAEVTKAQIGAQAQMEAVKPQMMTADELKDKYGTDDVELINAGREEQDRVELKEARSSADIKAEIERLQKELADAEVAEKKAGYNGNVPTEVWIWDIYLKPSKKGTWTSAELYQGKYDGYVYETEEDALDGAWVHLGELDDEGELRGDPDDYYVEAFSVPVSEVHEETLSYSGLDHLI